MQQKLQDVEMLILAGGLGTRLRSAIDSLPKPLAPIGGKPFLELLLKNYYRMGIRKFILSLHYQADLIVKFVNDLKLFEVLEGAEFRFVVEPELMGTGGAVAFAIKELGLNEAFFVANSDTWLDHGPSEMLNCGAPSIGLVHVEHNDRYGSVEFLEGKVTSFKEKEVTSGASYINAGLYFLSPKEFYQIKEKVFSIEKVLFPTLVGQGLLRAVVLESSFIDIGIPEDLHRFRELALTKKETQF